MYVIELYMEIGMIVLFLSLNQFNGYGIYIIFIFVKKKFIFNY